MAVREMDGRDGGNGRVNGDAGADGRPPDMRGKTAGSKKSQFKKGAPGRPKGAVNKIPYTAKEYIQEMFERVSFELPDGKRVFSMEAAIAWIESSAEARHAFYTQIWPKILPLQVNAQSAQRVAIEYPSYDALRRELAQRGIKLIDVEPAKQPIKQARQIEPPNRQKDEQKDDGPSKPKVERVRL
jgi:hypothetical protein